MPLRFEWDPRKARSNFVKHGIAFEEAATIFGDPKSLTIPDPKHSLMEERFVTMGSGLTAKLLVVVHAEREDTIRIIKCSKGKPTGTQVL